MPLSTIYKSWFLLLCLSILTSCSVLEQSLQKSGLVSSATPTAPISSLGVEALAGKTWKLIRYKNLKGTMLDIPSTYSLTLSFSKNEISGSGGCNLFHALLVAEGNQLAIGNLSSTNSYCVSDPQAMQYETEYFRLLPQTSFFHLEGNTLLLQNLNQETILVFSSELAK